MPLGRHVHDQIMLGLFHAEQPYDRQPQSWPDAACRMLDFDDNSPHATWDDVVEDNDALARLSEYPSVQELVRQSVRFTYTEPRVKPNTLAGLLALTLGGTPTAVQEGSAAAYRHSMAAVSSVAMLSMSATMLLQGMLPYTYTGLKASRFTLKTNGAYLHLSCDLLGSGTRLPGATPTLPAIPEAWMRWGDCRLWLKDVSAGPVTLPPAPVQGTTNLGAGALDISRRVLRMEIQQPNALGEENGYRPSTGCIRGSLHAGQRSTSLLLELEVDTATEATELSYYLTQARLAFEWQCAGALLVPGGQYRAGATIVLPCLQLQAIRRGVADVTDTLTLHGQVLSDGVNPPLQAWAYTGQPVYLQTAVFPLDLVLGATAGWSIRKLRRGYTGPALRVRRASDQAQRDIGFAGVHLDTGALETFCAGTNGYVTTWYDQSGNGRHLAQASLTAQPQIMAGGMLLRTLGGRAAFDFSTTFLQGNVSAGLMTATAGTVLAVWQADSFVTSNDIFPYDSGVIYLAHDADTGLCFLIGPNLTVDLATYSWDTGPRLAKYANVVAHTPYIAVWWKGQPYIACHVNAVNHHMINAGPILHSTSQPMWVGRNWADTGSRQHYYDGMIPELLVYAVALNDDELDLLGRNLGDYFTIPWGGILP